LASFIVRRLIQAIIVIIIITIISFLLLQIIPGDPVIRILGSHATQVQIDRLTHELGLDLPIHIQYFNWIKGIFKGDLGKSFIFHEDVARLIAERFPITVYLTFLSLALSTIVGVIAGVISAVKRGGIVDSFTTLFANIGIAIPTFWLGILGIYIFGLKLDWLPIEGWTSPFVDFMESTRQIIMPVIALSVPNIAVVTRQTRSSMLETIHQDYIRTATSKGLRKRIVLYKHALRNALVPVVTLVGVTLTFMIGGEVLVETVFNIPGVGRLLVRAALDRDFLIVQGIVLIVGTVVCLTNLLIDITYGWIDPRIRYR
jgi:peptide/nickel transport system permease protein